MGKVAAVLVPLLVTCPRLAAGPTSSATTEQALLKLKATADEVLKLDNVQARARIKAVFAAAEGLKDAGRDKQALHYYDAGLKCQPWALAHQLTYAQLLLKTGQKAQGVRRAKIVLDSAEQDKLIIPAMKIVHPGKRLDTEIQPLAKLEGTAFAVVLVPVGDAEVLLLKDLRAALEKELGITVMLGRVGMKMPPVSREPLKEFLRSVRKQLLKDGRDRLRPLLTQLKMKPADLDDDAKLLRFYRTLVYTGGGPAALRQFDLACPDPEPQWKAEDLVNLLKSTVRRFKGANVRFVGVTNVDIYSEGASFLFALRIDEYGVLSYRRFTSSFTRELPDRKRLLNRLLKQSLSSTSHTFGMERCSNPKCARAYPNSLKEFDAKLPKLCDECQKAFDTIVGKSGS